MYGGLPAGWHTLFTDSTAEGPPALRREEDKKVGEWDPQALLPFLPPAGRICKLQDLSK